MVSSGKTNENRSALINSKWCFFSMSKAQLAEVEKGVNSTSLIWANSFRRLTSVHRNAGVELLRVQGESRSQRGWEDLVTLISQACFHRITMKDVPESFKNCLPIRKHVLTVLLSLLPTCPAYFQNVNPSVLILLPNYFMKAIDWFPKSL